MTVSLRKYRLQVPCYALASSSVPGRRNPISTTSAPLARAAVDSLMESGVSLALLHREADLLSGDVGSDVDMAVGEPPRQLLTRSLSRLHAAGLHPVVVWEYDVAGTATVFLSTGSASDGVQLDLLFDPEGHGKYGVRTKAMIDAAKPGDRWPRADRLGELAYLIRKRQVKGDRPRMAELVAQAQSVPAAEFDEAVRTTLSDPAAGEVMAMVRERSSGGHRRPPAYWALATQRLGRRVLHPIGCWAELRGEGADHQSRALAARFGRFLLRGVASARPVGRPAQARWWAAEVAPVRWRAGLLVSWGGETPLVSPDVVISTHDRDLSALGSGGRGHHGEQARSVSAPHATNRCAVGTAQFRFEKPGPYQRPVRLKEVR